MGVSSSQKHASCRLYSVAHVILIPDEIDEMTITDHGQINKRCFWICALSIGPGEAEDCHLSEVILNVAPRSFCLEKNSACCQTKTACLTRLATIFLKACCWSLSRLRELH